MHSKPSGPAVRGRKRNVCAQCRSSLGKGRPRKTNSRRILFYVPKLFRRSNQQSCAKLCKSCKGSDRTNANFSFNDVGPQGMESVEAEDDDRDTIYRDETTFAGFGSNYESEDGLFMGFDEVLVNQSVYTSYFMNALLSHLEVSKSRRAIRVLSLFDGIATGLYVLQNILQLEVEVYYSSEIDMDAIRVQRKWHSNKLVELGTVTNLDRDILYELGRIDLFLGGSPCNHLSLVNPGRKGLHGESGTGPLFFEFVRIRDFFEKQAAHEGTPFFWLFENTSCMEKVTMAEISRHLGRLPFVQCASQYLPVTRKRNFWSNLPQMKDECASESRGVLQDFLMSGRIANVRILPTLTTTSHSQLSGPTKIFPAVEDGVDSLLYINEIEALFGLPSSYTDAGNLSMTKRRKLLGKAWCVPVIAHILSSLVDGYNRLDKSNGDLAFTSIKPIIKTCLDLMYAHTCNLLSLQLIFQVLTSSHLLQCSVQERYCTD